jgi:hypothetical protein
MTNTIRLVSNGKAIEETIGVPTDNEVSLYTRDGDRILMTHYCAMTPDGNQPRFETGPLTLGQTKLEFQFLSATNLHSEGAPHMRHVSLVLDARDRFSEKWTKTENGRDAVFDLNFVRR